MEKDKIKGISLVLKPCLLVSCNRRGEGFQLLFNRNKFQLFTFSDKLNNVEIPKDLSNLSPTQKKILDIVGEQGQVTTSELFVKMGISFNEVSGIVASLARKGLINLDKNKITSNAAIAANFRKMNFMERPKYINEPEAEKQRANVSEKEITGFLNTFGIQIITKKECWLPFFRVQTAGGHKTLDSLSYSLAI